MRSTVVTVDLLLSLMTGVLTKQFESIPLLEAPSFRALPLNHSFSLSPLGFFKVSGKPLDLKTRLDLETRLDNKNPL